ncbi:WYL domain-containing protein [Amycolatopsis sp.]|uniref:helix-turn-helix transcriptional regulator n=1 Tax=Amycolatopsis sp. TaxID=37632 RepID=UPI002D7E4EAD|nr:WYL domain-containing protein [Amycolatopsis sp.]HET6707136.1 WYL domain-containing protein [Amycolatopsis sp.]
MPQGGRWYLVAYDLTRHSWRSFRSDRLTGLCPTGARFRPRPLPAADAAANAGTSTGAPAAHTVRVRRAIGRWGTVEPAGEDRCHVTMTSTSWDWPAQALGNVGTESEVLGPPEFTAHVREWGARFVRAGGAMP